MQPSAITKYDTKKDEKKNAKSLIMSDALLRENPGSGPMRAVDFELIDGRGQDLGGQRLKAARR